MSSCLYETGTKEGRENTNVSQNSVGLVSVGRVSAGITRETRVQHQTSGDKNETRQLGKPLRPVIARKSKRIQEHLLKMSVSKGND